MIPVRLEYIETILWTVHYVVVTPMWREVFTRNNSGRVKEGLVHTKSTNRLECIEYLRPDQKRTFHWRSSGTQTFLISSSLLLNYFFRFFRKNVNIVTKCTWELSDSKTVWLYWIEFNILNIHAKWSCCKTF